MIARVLTLSVLLAGCNWFPKPADCTNGKIDGHETDVDCGGNCGGCDPGRICLGDQDCASHHCAVNHCEAASCIDGVQNGKETGVDCGGDCAPCEPCPTGGCIAPTCTDGRKNGFETDLDCGGPGCAPCPDGRECLRNLDCANGTCADAHCGPACPPPLLSCSEGCVDPRFDRANCGGCGMPCAGSDVCFAGQCGATCGGGTQNCGGDCVDPGSNPQHCGGCNQPCAPGEQCVAGMCNPACTPGQSLCNGQCVSFQFDSLNCGGCNQPCGAGSACVGGQCSAGCGTPLMMCSPPEPMCIDPRNDPNHCGDCMTSCPNRLNAARACVNSTCALGACQPGFEDCDLMPMNGCEAELGMDSMNCGTCGRQCSAGESCVFARCCGMPPMGSYLMTCQGCEACDGVLSCLCEDNGTVLQPTSMPLGCPMISNCNGVLTCGSC